MKKKMHGLLAGLFTFTVGCGLVYFTEPWMEHHVDGWFLTAPSSARGVAWCGLFFAFFFTGYVCARVVKAHELRWGLMWTLVTAAFVTGVSSWGSDDLLRRFPMPSAAMGWNALWSIAFYCLASIGGASAAQDVNRKKKQEKAEAVVEAVSEGVQNAAEIIHDIFKHH